MFSYVFLLQLRIIHLDAGLQDDTYSLEENDSLALSWRHRLSQSHILRVAQVGCESSGLSNDLLSSASVELASESDNIGLSLTTIVTVS